MISREYLGPLWEWSSDSWRHKLTASLGIVAIAALPLTVKGAVEGFDYPHGHGAQECTFGANPASWIGCPAYSVGMYAAEDFLGLANALGDSAAVVNPQM